jgi:flagellar secretion chaperone FliS
MSTYAPAPNAYRSNAIMTASPGQLVVMLYDGARRFLYQASVAMTDKQPAVAHQKLSRAEDIVRHLRSTLDFEQGGEISDRLMAIYTFSLRQMSEARFEQDPAKLNAVDGLLSQLRESWNSIAGE